MELLLDKTEAKGAVLAPDRELLAATEPKKIASRSDAVDEAFSLVAMLADFSKLDVKPDETEMKKVAAHSTARINAVAIWLNERHLVNNPITLYHFLKDPMGILVSEDALKDLPEDILELRDDHLAKAATVFPNIPTYLAMLDDNHQVRESDFASWIVKLAS